MNYLKIIEAAHACEVNRRQINECLMALGAAVTGDNTRLYLHKRVDGLDKEKEKLENKLRKLIEQLS